MQNNENIIQTNRGNIPIDNINIGDIVYEYITGNEFEIEKIIYSDVENIYRVEFNDNRFIYMKESELNHIEYMNTSDNSYDYIKNRIVNPLFPDPYIAGALLIYGDQDDNYLNLPFNITSVNNLFAHKYQLNYGDVVSSNKKVYFRYNGESGDKLITWDEFFSNYIFYARTGVNHSKSIIPLEYQRASIDDRYQFIRGVFDAGYNRESLGSSAEIIHENSERLLEVQKILWSLGISSIILENVSIRDKVKKYKLIIIKKYNKYPGLFYHINSMEEMMKPCYSYDRHPNIELEIKSIEWYSKTYLKNIILNKPKVWYLLDNFLPNISK